MLSDRVIKLQRTDVSITSSYLRLQNNTINLDRICTGFAVQSSRMLQDEVAGRHTVNISLSLSFEPLLESKLKGTKSAALKVLKV